MKQASAYRSRIYKSSTGETELQKFYDQQRTRLGFPTESRTVDTRFGATHVLVAGPEGAPPLVTVHGAYASAPYNLGLFSSLAQEYRVYAPDTVGQSVRSAPTYIDPRGNGYGYWLIDVLDGLGLDRVPFVTSSFGSGIFLRLATVAPTRISQAALVMPSGIANGSMLRIMKELLFPWLVYIFFPNRGRLIRACQPMMSEMDEDFIQLVDLMLRNVKIRAEGPRLTSKSDLAKFQAPVLIFVADDDVFFPASRVEPRAREIIPNLVALERVPGHHLAAKKDLAYINECVRKFLRERR